MKNHLIYLLGITCLLSNNVLAAQPRVAHCFGVGNYSCAEYVEAKQTQNIEKVNQFIIWMDGYFTAVTVYRQEMDTSAKSNVGENRKAELLWLENYCREKPFESFFNAVFKLEKELIPEN